MCASTEKDVIPDISVTRVLKWAVVLLIAMALGKKVWGLFGDKISKQLSQALDSPTKD